MAIKGHKGRFGFSDGHRFAHAFTLDRKGPWKIASYQLATVKASLHSPESFWASRPRFSVGVPSRTWIRSLQRNGIPLSQAFTTPT